MTIEPSFLEGPPRISSKSITQIHLGEDQKYFVLIDGVRHVAFTNYASLEEAHQADHDIRQVIASLQLADMDIQAKLDPSNYMNLARNLLNDAMKGMLDSPLNFGNMDWDPTKVQTAHVARGSGHSDYVTSQTQLETGTQRTLRGQTAVIQHVDDFGYIPCEGRNALPGE